MKAREITKAFILFIFMFLPSYAVADDLGELRISLVDGDVQIITEDTSDWVPVTINMPLRSGDRIWVPEGSRTEIQARSGTVVRLDEESSLEILTVEEDSVQFYLSLGQAYVNFRGGRDGMIQMDTPIASARVYDMARFNVEVSQNGDTDISVFKGALYAESRSGRTRVGAGKVLSLGDDYADLSPLGNPDEWEKWNRERDKRYEERGYSSQYLPGELEGYAGDFDNNGRWVYASSYGYVWTPTVHISAGWAPYRHGRWVWVGGDYVWIAYEPWGWAPYHYGRWTFITTFGWCWVPPARGAVYWGPGYVGWVYTPTYVAWVPLAPGETYYGYGHYGPHSVNITHVNINTIVVKKVYRNVHVNNAVTVVPHDTFLRGKREDIKVRENPFLKERISVGRPRIAPERATRIPVMREIPKAKEPPRRVREIKVRELKEKRRFVRESNRSVFAPKTSPKTMPVRLIEVPRKGGTVRSEEPEAAPGRRMQQRQTEQPGKAAPAKRKESRQAPEEKKMDQPQKSGVTQSGSRTKDVQTQRPAKEREGRTIKEEERIEERQREMKAPANQKELRQAPEEKRPEQPGTELRKQPVQKGVTTGDNQKQTKKSEPEKRSQQPDSRVSPETDRKKVKKGDKKQDQTQQEKEGVQEDRDPEFWPEKAKGSDKR